MKHFIDELHSARLGHLRVGHTSQHLREPMHCKGWMRGRCIVAVARDGDGAGRQRGQHRRIPEVRVGHSDGNEVAIEDRRTAVDNDARGAAHSGVALKRGVG